MHSIVWIAYCCFHRPLCLKCIRVWSGILGTKTWLVVTEISCCILLKVLHVYTQCMTNSWQLYSVKYSCRKVYHLSAKRIVTFRTCNESIVYREIITLVCTLFSFSGVTTFLLKILIQLQKLFSAKNWYLWVFSVAALGWSISCRFPIASCIFCGFYLMLELWYVGLTLRHVNIGLHSWVVWQVIIRIIITLSRTRQQLRRHLEMEAGGVAWCAVGELLSMLLFFLF